MTVQGKKATSESDSAVKGVPRKAVLHAFVGRLRLETTEEDLTKYLTDVSVKGVMCKNLNQKMGNKLLLLLFMFLAVLKVKTYFLTKTAGQKVLS